MVTDKASHFAMIVASVLAVAGTGCQDSAKDPVAMCDQLVSHPRDSGRQSGGVPDESVAVGPAIEACQRAVKVKPLEARLWFELGRAYWLGNRSSEAFAAFSEAANMDYSPAKKYIGDAYLEGRGLPPGHAQSARTALSWYTQSAQEGFEDGRRAVEEAQRLVLDPNLFIRPDFISVMYSGEFNKISAPISLLIYASAFNRELGGHEVFFLEPNCTPLSTLGGQTVLTVGQLMQVISAFQNKSLLQTALNTVPIMPFLMDEGKRDAVIFMSKYKCNTHVAKQLLGNLNTSYATIRETLNSFANRLPH